MKARATDAEKNVQELNAKPDRLQKTNGEQTVRIQKTKSVLKGAEEELMKVQSEATPKSEQLREKEKQPKGRLPPGTTQLPLKRRHPVAPQPLVTMLCGC